eukprot:COSAG04_NODE_1839_length_5436_cov_6.618887_1_plen_294_part_10
MLVTGITGRVGANVAQDLLDQGHEVRGFVWPGDRQSEKLEAIGAEIVEGDLASFEDVARAAEGMEVILNLGAAFQAGGPFTPQQFFDINVKGCFNVLEAALQLGDTLKHVVVISSDATMDKYPPEGIAEPIAEDTLPQRETGWYGYTKILNEDLADRYRRAHELPVTVIRFANAWGAGEAIETFTAFHAQRFIDQLQGLDGEESAAALATLQEAVAEAGVPAEEMLVVACDRNGRPWKKHQIEVRDILHAFRQIFAHREATLGQTYQIGSARPWQLDLDIPCEQSRWVGPRGAS